MRSYGRTKRHLFSRTSALALATLAPAIFAACYSGDGTPVDPNATHDPTGAAACATPSPGAAPLRRLTQSQYDNTVRDLLGDTTHPASGFPPDPTNGEFSNATSLTVSPLLAQGYQTAAEALAATAIANKASLLPCDPKAAAGEDACAKQFVEKLGRRAYRRPLTPDEVTALVALYAANKQGGTFDEGIQAVVEAMLQSAPFIYRVEFGAIDKAQGNVVPLTAYEMASRLSYFLWNSMPDDALFTAADQNALATPEQITAQARRMIADPKAHDTTKDFFDQWLKLKSLANVSKDAATYADWNDGLRSSMLAETRAFLDWVMWGSDGKVDTLLTSSVSFVDANTAKLYGVPAPQGSGLAKVTLDPSQRAGILTQPSILTIIAKPNQSSPVLRGKFVRERFLCQPLPPPPPDLVIVPPEVKPGATTRQRFAEHDKNPMCAGCHKMMDPIGFGFEHYDGVGKWRTVDQNLPVDATGALSDSDVDGAFDGAPALAAKLAQSKWVKDCIATEWFRYAFGRGETADDKCSLTAAKGSFSGAQYDMRELLVALTVTDAFRYRPEVKP
jgi:hypothetical protein